MLIGTILLYFGLSTSLPKQTPNYSLCTYLDYYIVPHSINSYQIVVNTYVNLPESKVYSYLPYPTFDSISNARDMFDTLSQIIIDKTPISCTYDEINDLVYFAYPLETYNDILLVLGFTFAVAGLISFVMVIFIIFSIRREFYLTIGEGHPFAKE
jgi:hypothetical protein